MKYKDVWTFNSYGDYFDPKLGLVYKDFKNNAFEIILCSTDYEHLTEEDIVIPVEESDLQYSLVVHSDMIFPLMKKDKKLNKKIGSVSDLTIEQIGLLRNDIKKTKKSEVRFNIGGPIFYKSDKRYFMKLTNLEFVNHLSENSYKKLLLDIPDNVVPFLTYKSEKTIFEGIAESQGRESRDLISKQLLALVDRSFKIEKYFHQVEDGEFTNLSIDFKKMEKDLKVLVA